MSIWRQVRRPPQWIKALIFIVAFIAYAAAGFMFFEYEDRPEIEWLDGLWWAVVTMTTVGFGDYFPSTTGGRLFVGIPTMLVGMGLLGYALSQIAAFILRAETLNRKGLAVQKLSAHTVVCNYPSKSRLIRLLEELRMQGELTDAPVLLIDEHVEEIDDDLVHRGVRFVRGHPARSDTLERAAITQAARAVVLARNATRPASDDLTVSICLMLNDLCPGMHVVAECVLPDNRDLLERAGCRSVVCVMDLAPGMLAQELHDPGVVDVLQELTVWHDDLNNVYIVPVSLTGESHKTFADLRQWSDAHNATVLGIKSGTQVALNPARERKLSPGDTAIVISRARPAHIQL